MEELPPEPEKRFSSEGVAALFMNAYCASTEDTLPELAEFHERGRNEVGRIFSATNAEASLNDAQLGLLAPIIVDHLKAMQTLVWEADTADMRELLLLDQNRLSIVGYINNCR